MNIANLNISTWFNVASADYSKTLICGLYELEIYRAVDRKSRVDLIVTICETDALKKHRDKEPKYDMLTEKTFVPTSVQATEIHEVLNDIELSVKIEPKDKDEPGVNRDLHPFHVSFNAKAISK